MFYMLEYSLNALMPMIFYFFTEPGFYKEGAFGIRIENILIVKQSNKEGFYDFKNVTRVPYERKLINLDLLSEQDIQFIDAYHQEVRNNSGF